MFVVLLILFGEDQKAFGANQIRRVIPPNKSRPDISEMI